MDEDRDPTPKSNGGFFHCILAGCGWIDWILFKICCWPSTGSTTCTVGKQDISTGMRTILMCSAIMQALILIAIIASMYTFSMVGAEDTIRITALWYEIPSGISIAYCLFLFVRSAQWTRWIVIVYGSMETTKVMLDALVLITWYTGLGQSDKLGLYNDIIYKQHTVLLILLLSGSLILSVVNLIIMYNAYNHWCASQSKVDTVPDRIQDEEPVVIDVNDHPPATSSSSMTMDDQSSKPSMRPTKSKRKRKPKDPPPVPPRPRQQYTYTEPYNNEPIDLFETIESSLHQMYNSTAQVKRDVPPSPPQSTPSSSISTSSTITSDHVTSIIPEDDYFG